MYLINASFCFGDINRLLLLFFSFFTCFSQHGVWSGFASLFLGSGRNDGQVQYIKLSRGSEVQPSFFLSTASHFAFQYQFLRHWFFRKILGAQRCFELFQAVCYCCNRQRDSSIMTCCNVISNQKICRTRMTAVCGIGQNKIIWKTMNFRFEYFNLLQILPCHLPPQKNQHPNQINETKTNKKTPTQLTKPNNPKPSVSRPCFGTLYKPFLTYSVLLRSSAIPGRWETSMLSLPLSLAE